MQEPVMQGRQGDAQRAEANDGAAPIRPDSAVNRPDRPNGDEAAGKGLSKKLTCWICGRDLIFNSVRVSAGAFHVQLFCKGCNTPRSVEMHLHPGDAYTMFGNTQD
jgi:hypothetical protein